MRASEFTDRLEYDPKSGELRWKLRDVTCSRDKAWNTRHAGTVAGCVHKDGYTYISFHGRPWLAHRVIWAMMMGAFPHKQIDHINGDRSDNRWDNLRLATVAQNQWNRPSKSYHYSKSRDRWRVRVVKQGKQIYIGDFRSEEEARQASIAARAEHYGEFGRHG
jgi:hypothetical protein